LDLLDNFVHMLAALETIAVRRRRLGLTQSQLAKQAGVSQSYIAKLEAKKIEPSYTRVRAILEALQRLERSREARANEIMTKDVVGVQVCDKVQSAVKLMRETGYSQLPVFDGERSVGSLSESTIIDRIVDRKRGEVIADGLVSEIMDDAFPQVGEDAPVSLLTSLLRVYPAVLVSKKGEIAGIVTKADLLKTLNKNQT
jgi:predicted transcriptional regulator